MFFPSPLHSEGLCSLLVPRMWYSWKILGESRFWNSSRPTPVCTCEESSENSTWRWAFSSTTCTDWRRIKLVSRKRGLYKRFYNRLDFEAEEQEILGILLQETERDLLLYLLRTPGASQKELSEFARISASSTSWHMKRLIQTGLVESRRQGSFVYYIAKGDPAKILTLLKSYHPRVWERWAERLADLLT